MPVCSPERNRSVGWHSRAVTVPRYEGPPTWAERMWWLNIVAAVALSAPCAYVAFMTRSTWWWIGACLLFFGFCRIGSELRERGRRRAGSVGQGHEQDD